MDCISVTDFLIKNNKKYLYKKQKTIITGDEKWIGCNNVQRKITWEKRNEAPLTTSKAGLHPKKVMASIW